jgi:M6 family metalloprotease-like protein
MKKIVLLIVFLFVFLSGKSAYFERLPYIITQPNGITINCFVSGDEFFNWLHDEEGYSIIQAADGYYYYAIQDGEFVIPSKYIANTVNPANVGLKKWAKISESEYYRRREELFKEDIKEKSSFSKAPHSGILNNIVIYIRFSDDAEITTTRQVYDVKFNELTTNSLNSYYKEVSYNNLNIYSTHYPSCALTTNLSYQDSHPRGYFQPYNATSNPIGYLSSQRTDREHQLLADAIDWINMNSPVDLSLNLDGDSDDKVDNVCFIIKGNSGAWSNLLWAHRWNLYSQNVYLNGKRVYDYTFQPENQVTVKTLCHEMFHALGAPDLYHYNNQGVISPAGGWDLMESGGGHMLTYMKWKYSNHTWISNIPQITTSGTYTLKPITSATNNCYKIASPYSSNEYFMVEYRYKAGIYESNIPGSGLIVYRIDTTIKGNSNGPPDEVYIYRPGGNMTVNGTLNNANFTSLYGRTSINDTTDPYCFLQTGGIGGLNLSNVTGIDTTISFDITFPLPCNPPSNQATTFTSSAITSSSMSIGFNRGNGNSVLVMARAWNAVNAIPVNGLTYVADTTFGNGIQIGSGNYVVYNGTGNSVNLSLSSGTLYHYAIFEYDSITKCYNSNALTGSASTLCIPLSITSQPVYSQNLCTPTPNNTISVVLNGSNPIKYKWQYNDNGLWKNVTNDSPLGATYSNTSTSSLTIKDIIEAGTFQYRCNLSNCSALYKDTSNISTLIVNLTPPVAVITQSGDTLISSANAGNQWYELSLGLIPGAVGNIYIPTQNGGYFVYVSLNGCMIPNKSNTIFYNNTGLSSNLRDQFQLTVSPNPFTDKVTIEYTLSENTDVEFSLFDVAGKMIMTFVKEQQNKGIQTTFLDASRFSKGLYFYILKAGEKQQQGKLIRL